MLIDWEYPPQIRTLSFASIKISLTEIHCNELIVLFHIKFPSKSHFITKQDITPILPVTYKLPFLIQIFSGVCPPLFISSINLTQIKLPFASNFVTAALW